MALFDYFCYNNVCSYKIRTSCNCILYRFVFYHDLYFYRFFWFYIIYFPPKAEICYCFWGA